jgi:hypothetical protein
MKTLQSLSLGLLLTFFAQVGVAADIPGGLIRTAEGMASNTFEMMLSPGYMISQQGGAYLTSELRYQAGDDIGLGIGVGAGEVGFNIGANATWYLLPDIAGQPAVSILGGLYLNRLDPANYFVLRFSPTVSKSYKTDWGRITPYGGFNLSPSFQLGNSYSEFSVKTSLGLEFSAQSLNGLNLWAEVGVGVISSFNEIVLGLSYPFKSL